LYFEGLRALDIRRDALLKQTPPARRLRVHRRSRSSSAGGAGGGVSPAVRLFYLISL